MCFLIYVSGQQSLVKSYKPRAWRGVHNATPLRARLNRSALGAQVLQSHQLEEFSSQLLEDPSDTSQLVVSLLSILYGHLVHYVSQFLLKLYTLPLSLGLDQSKQSFFGYPDRQSLLSLDMLNQFSQSWSLDLSSTSKLVSSSRLEHGVPVQPRPSHSYSSFSWPTSVSRLEAEPSSARLSGYHQPQSQDMSKLPWSSSPSNANQARYMFFKSSPLAGTQPLSLLSEPSKLLASGVQLETSSKAKQSRSGALAETHGLLLLDYLGIFSQSWLIHLDAIGKRSVSKSLATIWQALQASHQYAQFSHYWRLALGVIRSTRARSLESNGLALRVVSLQYTRSKWSLLSSVCVSYLRQLLFSATWFAPLESQPLLKVVYTSQLLGGIGDEG